MSERPCYSGLGADILHQAKQWRNTTIAKMTKYEEFLFTFSAVPSIHNRFIFDLLGPIVQLYRPRFTLFQLRGGAWFAMPELYEYSEQGQLTHFIGSQLTRSLIGRLSGA
jgi:hypothetical protein